MPTSWRERATELLLRMAQATGSGETGGESGAGCGTTGSGLGVGSG
jgi:hypothetical protein